VLRIDHNSLRYFMEQKDLNERQQKWVSKIQEYDFEIEYVKGKNNVVFYALSRIPIACSLMEISVDWKSHLFVEYSKNQFACELMDGVIQNDRYRVVDDIIFYKYRIYLVTESMLKENILRASHDTPLARQPGYFKTYKKVQERFSWKGLKDYVLWYVRVYDLLAEQVREYTPDKIITASTHSRAKMRECVDGLYHRFTKGIRKKLHTCSGRSVTNFAHFFAISSEYKETQVA
jgi:hypothetical protein